MVLPFPLSPPLEGGSQSFHFVTSPLSPPSKGGDNPFIVYRKQVIYLLLTNVNIKTSL